jgi:hypothetical protein
MDERVLRYAEAEFWRRAQFACVAEEAPLSMRAESRAGRMLPTRVACEWNTALRHR